MDESTANAIYDILVEECDAHEAMRAQFVYHQTREHVIEWRFIGALGFGGKFWRMTAFRPDGTWGRLWLVNCYPEDSTPEREAMIEAANERLWTLLSKED